MNGNLPGSSVCAVYSACCMAKLSYMQLKEAFFFQVPIRPTSQRKFSFITRYAIWFVWKAWNSILPLHKPFLSCLVVSNKLTKENSAPNSSLLQAYKCSETMLIWNIFTENSSISLEWMLWKKGWWTNSDVIFGLHKHIPVKNILLERKNPCGNMCSQESSLLPTVLCTCFPGNSSGFCTVAWAII